MTLVALAAGQPEVGTGADELNRQRIFPEFFRVAVILNYCWY